MTLKKLSIDGVSSGSSISLLFLKMRRLLSLSFINDSSLFYVYYSYYKQKNWSKYWIIQSMKKFKSIIFLFKNQFSSVNFHPFDDDLMSDLPSCVYATQHLTNSTNQSSSLCINTNLRQIQHQYLHHSGNNRIKHIIISIKS